MDPYKWELSVAKNYYPGAQAWVQYEDDKSFIGGRVRRPKNGVCQNTPRIVGYMILDYAKARMIEFLMRMRKICPTPPVLLYMDTDSAIMHLKGEADPYEVMRRDPELSDFAAGKAMGHIQTGREGQLGLFKDELLSCKNGVCTVQCITEYAGSEAKTYSLQKEAVSYTHLTLPTKA